TEWESFLRQELKDCRAMVVAWTPASVKSAWVELEASAGLEIDGLVPVQLDRFDAAAIPSKFAGIHAADLTLWGGEAADPDLKSVLRVLRDICSRPATAPSLADSSDLPYSLSLGGDLGSSDPRDLMWIDGRVRDAGKKAVPALLAALQFQEPDRR